MKQGFFFIYKGKLNKKEEGCCQAWDADLKNSKVGSETIKEYDNCDLTCCETKCEKDLDCVAIEYRGTHCEIHYVRITNVYTGIGCDSSMCKYESILFSFWCTLMHKTHI